MAALPSRHDPIAPLFDPAHPESLHRYLEDIEDLFSAFPESATSEFAKKRLAVKYIPLEVEELWRSLSEFHGSGAYTAFKSAVQRLYPTIAPEQRWRVEDLERVVRKWSEEGIQDVTALSGFYQEFLRIAQPLRSYGFISEQELDHAFSSAFGPSLWEPTFLRLQIVHPSHPPHHVHPFRYVYEAALFALQSAETYRQSIQIRTRPDDSVHQPTPSPASPVVSPALIDDIIAAVTQRLSPLIPAMSAPSLPPIVQSILHSSSYKCHYCGAIGCCITQCPVATEDITAGRCRHNTEGRLVLPSGRFIPRSLPGATMRERLHIWHMRYPVRERTSVQSGCEAPARVVEPVGASGSGVPGRAHVFGTEEQESDTSAVDHKCLQPTRTALSASGATLQPSLSATNTVPIHISAPAPTYTIAKASSSPYRITVALRIPQEVECVVDPGAQVNMLSEALCEALCIPFDPGVRLAARTSIGGDQSLGLARNITIVVEGHSFIVQAHVVRDAAYSLLLGAPFISAFAALESAEPL
ncbi:hypothetical protein NEOLEDRAFT_1180303 [Neolentinus lepideus HHB14362 ss-1]|uniref:Peptidase A2 domain-containing protein n=1 Tax=Neolentinus lepideus HHB14362 ss-1 TaxID=1314782 RepID=A0A165QYL0_9AGAM|nr:hypothetical protein NEOLEDRAFT_1180303 [Neolentinus lepideus HHB14362 ss-1]